MQPFISYCARLFLIFLLVGTAVKAQEPAAFNEGNRLYEQQQFAEAAAKYQQLIDSGFQVADLYFNAGNAYYKSSQTAMAVYSFEKALRLQPGDEAIEHNLALANQKVGSNVETLPLLFFERWWLQWQQLHTPAGWANWSIAWSWIFSALVIAYFFFPVPGKKYIRWALAVSGIFLIGYFSMAAWMHSQSFNSGDAIVMNNSVKAKSAPDDGAKDLFELKEGMKVEVLDATSQFGKVQLSDGKTGWVPVNEIRRL
ncbi:tetratricopeptide repeat protein [Chitinophaga rhizosphaerae]|uniref:tetratricopeptide repeat protein n=1 Tax=Chitinophaga rhizosphaerae TaxID=1864947 RepID=UPI000F802FA4|nr:tetratricopeptide repeat protein [Chitinophaga rhizosphaerae]